MNSRIRNNKCATKSLNLVHHLWKSFVSILKSNWLNCFNRAKVRASKVVFENWEEFYLFTCRKHQPNSNVIRRSEILIKENTVNVTYPTHNCLWVYQPIYLNTKLTDVYILVIMYSSSKCSVKGIIRGKLKFPISHKLHFNHLPLLHTNTYTHYSTHIYTIQVSSIQKRRTH